MKPKDWLTDFAVETMAEMAGNFFSRRVALENKIGYFTRECERLAQGVPMLVAKWRTMARLLFLEQGVPPFFEMIHGKVERIPMLLEEARHGDPWRYTKPFALTLHGRYEKSVRLLYQVLREEVRTYMEGRYVDVPGGQGRKKLTANYHQLAKLEQEINEEVRKLTNEQPPHLVLGFAKGLDIEGAAQERAAGVVNGGAAEHLDRGLAFDPVSMERLGLRELVCPPPIEEVGGKLDSLIDALFKANRQAVKPLLESLIREA